MENQTDKAYFADTTAISNSQLRTFVSYNKYGQRFLTPDDYMAEHIDKAVEFVCTDAVIIWKIVDKFFDWEGKKVWDYFIPVARRWGKEIQKIIDKTIDEAWEISDTERQNIIDQINDEYMEITIKMQEEAETMIARWLSFRRFKQFLQTEWTEAQVQLRTEVEITDSKTGEVRKISMKWKPDFVNNKMKLIVDLKTTWSRSMIIDDLQFKGEPNLTANYIRQLAIYNKMSGGDFDWALALVTSTWVKWIFIPNQILVDAWEIIEKDVLALDDFLKNPESLNESIFTYDESLDNLSL